MSIIDEMLQGSIDMHVHYGPDPRIERRFDALHLALEAQEMGMRGIVLKSHEYPTMPVAYTVSQTVKNIIVFGSVTLDLEVGGLNPYAVEASAKIGAKVVWMPTFTSANNMKAKGLKGGIRILDESEKILPVIGDILDIIRTYNMVLATGHISLNEAVALVDAALQKHITKIVITHPLWPGVDKYTLEAQQLLSKKGAFLEYCFSHVMPLEGMGEPQKTVAAIKSVGAEHCIMSTDFGQGYNPSPPEGMRMAIGRMLQLGITKSEMELLVKQNPANLLDLF